ncbi:MAG: Ribose-5-phosphate isomerase B [Fimbriimonadaceae bacterium]|nr:Ribose-5-phosphate isomerase B [Fimbriimonadaceae bacterium]
MKLAFGSDHAGFELRKRLVDVAKSWGHEVLEAGATSSEAYDYPDAADETVQLVLDETVECGILICGSGVGICMRANRHPGIRAANCCSVDMAALARQHNHANVLCLGARFTEVVQAEAILRMFLETGPDLEARHVRRVKKLDQDLNDAKTG